MQTLCSTICAVLDLFSESVCILGWFLFLLQTWCGQAKLALKENLTHVEEKSVCVKNICVSDTMKMCAMTVRQTW